MSADIQIHKITNRKVLDGIQRLIGMADALAALEESPHEHFAGMTMAIQTVGKILAEHKIALYQKINRDMARAGIDIGSLAMVRISGADTIEYSTNDLVDDMESTG